MSNHLTSLAYKADVGSLLRKAVLVLLADKASDDGSGIWASKQTMADELCCSKQAVLNALRQFETEKLIRQTGQREHQNGYTIEYKIDVTVLEALPKVQRWREDRSISLTSQPRLPLNRIGQRGQPRLPKPSLNLPEKEEAKASPQKPEVGIKELQEAWNAIPAAKGAVQCKRIGPERRRKADSFVRRYPVEDITEAIHAVARSDFLCGRGQGDFRADIDFLFSPKHMNRLLEGFYER